MLIVGLLPQGTMSIRRIPPVLPTPAIRQPLHSSTARPVPGDSVLLVRIARDGKEGLAVVFKGQPIGFVASTTLERPLPQGDVLIGKVLSSDEVLTLQLFDDASSEPAPELPWSDHPAMRFDPGTLASMSWQPPTAAALARVWRAQFDTRETNLHSVWDLMQPRGMRVGLAVIPSDELPRRRRRRRLLLAVRVELLHPSLGYIVLEVYGHPPGTALTLAVEHSAWQPIHAYVPAISAALARAELPLVRLRLTRGERSRLRALVPPGSPRLSSNDTGSESDLFRAAAEASFVLLSPASPRC